MKKQMNIVFNQKPLHTDKFINLVKNIDHSPLQFFTHYPFLKLKKFTEAVGIEYIQNLCGEIETARNCVCHLNPTVNTLHHDFRRDISTFQDVLDKELMYVMLALEEK
jgi:hypothetical protein